jgi:hypothetical protein
VAKSKIRSSVPGIAGKNAFARAARTKGKGFGPGKIGTRGMTRGLKKKGTGVNPFTSTLGSLNE